MNDHEYTAIAAEIGTMFPSLGEWFARLSNDAQEAQRRRRRAALIELPASDVRAAISDISALPESPWAGWGQFEWAFGMIGKRARDIKAKRSDSAKNEATIKAGHRYDSPRALGSARQEAIDFADARKRGELPDAASVIAWFEARHGTSDDTRDRARCVACRDSGMVRVVSTLRRRDGRWRWTETSVACPCQAGQQSQSQIDDERKVETYDDAQHVRVKTFATEVDILAEVAATNDRYAKRSRIAGFDQFNDANMRAANDF